MAKGVSIVLIGVLVVAAVRSNLEEATGLDAARKGLTGQPYGPYPLIALALGLGLGLIAYGSFDARYDRG